MEKVKLTPSQAEVLEKAFEIVNQDKSLWPLLTSILKNGYEIEEFKVGDWVVFKSGLISKITKTDISHKKEQLIQVDNIEPGEDADDEYIPVSHVVRKATPEEIADEKERRKWAAIGREVGEYHAGDFVRHKRYGIDMVGFVDANGIYLKALKNYYDKDQIELICPVEQRFDLKEDDE
jgi:hypothetical protein